MINSWLKIFNILILILTILFTLTSKSWIFIWALMEMNMFTFLCSIKILNYKTINSLMKYFIIQVLASNLFLMTILILKMNMMNNLMNMILFLSIWLKLGLFPFNSWYLQVNEYLDWFSFFILNIFQKIIPLFILSLNFNFYILIFSSISITTSVLDMLYLNSLRWILGCSSINHFSWMTVSIYNLNYFWQLYLIIYLSLLMMLFLSMKILNVNSLNNMFNMKFNNLKIYFMTLFLSFAGIPPFLGFLPKLNIIMNNSFNFIIILFLLSSFVNTFIYLRFFLPLMSKKYYFKKFNLSNNIIFMNLISSSMIFLCMSFFF